MGAWEELDTEISVEVDTLELENLKDFLDNDLDGIFEPAYYIVEDLITQIDEGSKNGVEEIAKKNVSFQEQLLGDTSVHPYSQGVLETSIDYEGSDYTYITGTRINHIYPLCVEFGRGEIVPVSAKALAFYALSGELIFTKRVGKAEPRPFVAPAYDKTEAIAGELMLREVNHAIRF